MEQDVFYQVFRNVYPVSLCMQSLLRYFLLFLKQDCGIITSI
jgi:hypothetical protein